MDNSRLRRILTIVDAAISQNPQERTGYLTAVCGDDTELRNEVESLLKSIYESEDFWEDWRKWSEKQIHNLFQQQSKPAEDDLETERIGPWRLIQLLGQGGMGSVFLAERADGQFEQQAALKLLHKGLEAGKTFRRFEQERQILAKLDHPHIAGFYDGGITKDGRPWLAMQYVDGVSITEWCRLHKCALSERLNLFRKICEAVRYAHKNLIIHRDLKPENILVTENGIVKVLDFGIAKLIDDKLSEANRIQTQTGLRVMSLDYAAPEQITGESITTATDVYALGLLLYELLTEAYPFELKGKNRRQIEQILRNQDPQKPSFVTESWGKQLQGDLDAITLKALRKEPEQRYENASQMLDDIQRYQSHLPVLARGDTLRYRVNKFYKRHRVGVLAAILLILTLLGGIAGITWQAQRAADQARIAKAERDAAREVSAFLEELFNASDPFVAAETGRPDTMRVRNFLEHGAAKIQKELKDQPAVQARMLNVVGDVYINLGLFDDALMLLKQSLTIHRMAGTPADIAKTLESIARALARKGDYDTAEHHYREALALRQRHQAENNQITARAMVGLAIVLGEKSAYDEAESLLRKALTIQENLLSENHPETAETLRQLGILFHHQANLVQAEFYYDKALTLLRALHGNSHLDVAQSLLNLATLHREKGDYAAAEPLIREGLEIRQNVLGEAHPLTVTTIYELAILLRDKDNPQIAQAADLFRKVISLDRKQLGETHHYVGLDLFELGIALNKMKDFNEAARAYHQSLAVLRQSLPEGHPDIAKALTGLGDTLIKQGKPAEAEPLLREGLQIRRDKLGEKVWRTGVSKSVLGWAIMMQGRYREAEPLLLEGYATLRDNDGPTRAALERLVMLYERKGQDKQAAVYQRLLSEAKY